jgi:triphosphoribosyl-dephospho-CoA synthase
VDYRLHSSDVEAAVLTACRLDVVAPKPGNVSVSSPGHGMSAGDFFASARAIAPLLAAPGISVGQRILGSVEASVEAVGCNTNLGIVLLAAPMAHAALHRSAETELRPRVSDVLNRLTLDDSRRVFAAIRRAAPAGLGRAGDQDVFSEPTLELRSVMRIAADRDRVAYQYVHDFEDVFTVGFPALREYLQRWDSLACAVVGCYLRLLGRARDSHVLRKYGSAVADEVMSRAAEVETAFKACENPYSRASAVEDFDRELKTRGVNPGTSADLTVASILAFSLEPRLRAKKI